MALNESLEGAESEMRVELIKEFYRLDASYCKLPKADQIRLFETWAIQQGIKERLYFESPPWVAYIRWVAIVSGILYLVSFVPGAPGMARALFSMMMVAMILWFTFDDKRPVVKLSE